MRIPVKTQEPLLVSPDVPNVAYEQKRYTLPIDASGGGVIGMIGPPEGYFWKIDAVQMECTASGNVGTRVFYYYGEDKNARAFRHMCMVLTAGQIGTYIAAPGAAASTRTFAYGAGMITATGPSYFDVMQFPCKVGGKFDFALAGDTCNMHIIVREYRNV